MTPVRLLAATLVMASCTVGESTPLEGDPAELSPNAAAAPPATLVWPVLRQGASNRSVVAAQYLLRDAGQTLAVDGSFSAGTATAARSFQGQSGLAVDGVIGSGTWPRLVVELRQGDESAAVSAAQDLLKNRYGKSLDVTGVFGTTTATRVKAFQTEKCLAPTGVVGLYTWHALIAEASYCAGSGGDAGTILASHQARTLTLWDQTFGRFDGADPLSNVRDAAAGRPAKTSCYGNAPCTSVTLSPRLLAGMAQLRTRYGFRYFVTSIAGATHSSTSLHYAGRAFDIDEINGAKIVGDSTASRQFMAACTALGAIEVLGPSNDSGHQDHIHCGW